MKEGFIEILIAFLISTTISRIVLLGFKMYRRFKEDNTDTLSSRYVNWLVGISISITVMFYPMFSGFFGHTFSQRITRLMFFVIVWVMVVVVKGFFLPKMIKKKVDQKSQTTTVNDIMD